MFGWDNAFGAIGSAVAAGFNYFGTKEQMPLIVPLCTSNKISSVDLLGIRWIFRSACLTRLISVLCKICERLG